MRQSRMPQIGDLLLTTCPKVLHTSTCICRSKNEKHIGIVHEIELDKYGHQNNVHVMWSSLPPPNYREKYGYAGVNIYNLRSLFTIIRDGRDIQ